MNQKLLDRRPKECTVDSFVVIINNVTKLAKKFSY